VLPSSRGSASAIKNGGRRGETAATEPVQPAGRTGRRGECASERRGGVSLPRVPRVARNGTPRVPAGASETCRRCRRVGAEGSWARARTVTSAVCRVQACEDAGPRTRPPLPRAAAAGAGETAGAAHAAPRRAETAAGAGETAARDTDEQRQRFGERCDELGLAERAAPEEERAGTASGDDSAGESGGAAHAQAVPADARIPASALSRTHDR